MEPAVEVIPVTLNAFELLSVHTVDAIKYNVAKLEHP